jgi:hypothetical protein
VLHGEIDESLKRFWTDTRERHRFLQHDRERPILPPEDLFLKPEDFRAPTNMRCLPCAAASKRPGRGRCPTSAWSAARPSR